MQKPKTEQLNIALWNVLNGGRVEESMMSKVIWKNHWIRTAKTIKFFKEIR